MISDTVTGLVLSGGRGSRMGGIDKDLQPFRGRPLVEWVIERIEPQVADLAGQRQPEPRPLSRVWASGAHRSDRRLRRTVRRPPRRPGPGSLRAGGDGTPATALPAHRAS